MITMINAGKAIRANYVGSVRTIKTNELIKQNKLIKPKVECRFSLSI